MKSSQRFQGTKQYVASAELQEIVNVAVDLERPLLIRGEPGTGKTLLARAIAESLDMTLHTWHIKSTSKAHEGLYTYDTVQRLNDSRFGDGDVSNIDRYIKLGPLGKAFQDSKRSLVLIDEIDKADIEFPNDLLHELDAMSFYISETGKTITAQQRPVIIITSNAEKELPDAFLRRCLFHYIAFPEAEQMRKIVDVHFAGLDEKLLSQALTRFYWLRELDDITKKPSTSEFIDWLSALQRAGIASSKLQKELPFLGVLLKKEDDLGRLDPQASSRSSRFFRS